AADFILRMERSQNGDERGNARASRDKQAFAFVRNVTEHIVQNQFVSFFELQQLIRYTLPSRISLNGKLQVIVRWQGGKRECSFFIFPLWLVHAYIGSLTRNINKPAWFFGGNAQHIMCSVFDR